jgi:Tol biopolymer transport system component
MRRTPLLFAALALFAILSSYVSAAEVIVVAANPDTKTAYTDPVWSPNGRSIAYVGLTYANSPNEPTFGKTDTNVYIATLAGGKWSSKELVKNADWPVWSPDGKKLMVDRGGLASVDVATGKITQITKRGLATNPDYPVSWSPNGRYLVYMSYRKDVPTPLIRDLKTAKDLSVAPGVVAVWMKDGKLLTAMCGPYCPAEGGWLKIIDPASGASSTLLDKWCVQNMFPLRGGSSAWVLLTPTGPHGEGIYTLDMKKGSTNKQTALHALEVSWSPDASQFAFITMYAPVGSVAPKSTLYVGDTGIWKFKIVAKDAAGTDDKLHQHAQWSPNSRSIAYVTELGDIKILKL